MTLAYITAPFAHQVFLQIPEYARRSRQDLMHFARSLNTNPKSTANTKLEFVTLRIFPFRKNTATFLHELRALPPAKFRLANIELPQSEEWAKRQRAKGIFKRIMEVIREPRFKFYVKEGKMYTNKTGVPGVWEEVAKRIREQTALEKGTPSTAKVAVARPPALGKQPGKALKTIQKERIKRQTYRSPR